MNNSTRDEWCTPHKLYNSLYEQYEFSFDCCANEGNTKCANWSNDFLNYWPGRETRTNIFWMNPPFSRAQKMFNHFFTVVTYGIAIYRCDNIETDLWQNTIIPQCDWIFVLRGRVKYDGFSGSSPRFPSALIGVGLPHPYLVEGWVLITPSARLSFDS